VVDIYFTELVDEAVADPHSGSAILMELAKAIGKLLETGWRPKRTIILCSWDAEEYGLVGR